MENLNLVELLRDCPTGMELDCTVFDNVTFDYVNTQQNRVYCKVNKSESVWFTSKGSVNNLPDAKCVIFPKGKTTWEGFVPPCKFKDGDIIYVRAAFEWVAIYKENNRDDIYKYVGVRVLGGVLFDDCCPLCYKGDIREIRLATEDEKQKLFQAIKDNGYKWNTETKTLEKLPKFKVGDWVIDKQDIVHQIANVIENVSNHTYGYDIVGGGYFNDNTEGVRLWTIQDTKEGDVLIDRCGDYKNPLIFILKKFETVDFGIAKKSDYSSYCFLSMGDKPRFKEGQFHHIHNIKPATKEQRDLLFEKMKEAGYEWDAEKKELEKLIEPKFKVGDRIKDKNNKIWFVVQVSDKHFDISLIPNAEGYFVPIEDQDNYELVSNKFDITTLKPFDKVLVRDCNEDKWNIDFFGYYRDDGAYQCMTFTKNQCIPYEGNEQLLGKTDDCDDFYKTW